MTLLYPELKAWADEYFYIPHRHRAREVGGIFMDDRCTGDWGKDFELTKTLVVHSCLLLFLWLKSNGSKNGLRPDKKPNLSTVASMPSITWSMIGAQNLG